MVFIFYKNANCSYYAWNEIQFPSSFSNIEHSNIDLLTLNNVLILSVSYIKKNVSKHSSCYMTQNTAKYAAKYILLTQVMLTQIKL